MKNNNLHHLVQPEIRRLFAEGLKQNEFKTYYNPIIDVQVDEVVFFDLSICWHHERYGVLEAMQFLPIIQTLPEYDELAHRFFAYVAKRIRYFKRMNKQTKLMIPISANQLKMDEGIDMLLHFLNNHQITSENIVLNIMGYAENLPDKLTILSRLGFQTVISYELCTKYAHPIADYVFINRHTIEKKRLLGEPLLKRVLQSTLKKLKCQFIVQNIEEESHQLFLQKYGLRYFQGPYYTEPLLFEDMMKKLL